MSDLRFQYLLDADSQYADSGPNGFNDAAAQGNGFLQYPANMPLGAGYSNDDGSGGNHVRMPTGIAGNPGTGDWTFQCRARGFDWDAGLGSISVGVIALSVGNTTDDSRIAIITSTLNDDFIAFGANNSDPSASFNIDSNEAAVNNTVKFFSITRSGTNVYFHINGVFRGSASIAADAVYDFSTAYVTGLSNFFATLPTHGLIGEVAFYSRALYNENDYTPPPASFYSEPTSESALLRAWAFDFDGHSFYPMRLGQTGTFVYDIRTQQWSNWETSGETVWNAVHGVEKWNDMVVAADQTSSSIYKLTADTAVDEGSLPISCTTTGILKNRERDPLLLGELRISASVGAPYQDLASVTLRWSDDQGQSYTTPLTIELEDGNDSQQLRWRSLGRFDAPLRIFEISDTGGLARINGCDVEVR